MEHRKIRLTREEVKTAINMYLQARPCTYRVVDDKHLPELQIKIVDTGRAKLAASTKWRKVRAGFMPHPQALFLAEIRNAVYALTGVEVRAKLNHIDRLIELDAYGYDTRFHLNRHKPQYLTAKQLVSVRKEDCDTWDTSLVESVDWSEIVEYMVVRSPVNGWYPATVALPPGDFVVVLCDTGYKLVNLLETSIRQWENLGAEWYRYVNV